MIALGTELKDLAAQLTTAFGKQVVIDPRDLTLPGVLLAPGTIQTNRLDGETWQVDIEIWLIASAAPTAVALDELSSLITSVQDHIPAGTWEPMTLTLAAQSPDPLPAFRAQITLTVTT